MVSRKTLVVLASIACPVLTCDSCYGPRNDIVMTRNIRRMQPDAQAAIDFPTRELEWGQLNVVHTTDTHGWLEGHLKETNYGADWGDFKSFVKHMRNKADEHDVDLLLVDTGDLHDGTGLSDATSPDGAVTDQIFKNIDYDLLTIGNHELYLSETAYETFNNISKVYGDRYLTSNVKIFNPASQDFQYIGKPYRYFETKHGLRIMAFGFLYDMTGNTNVSKITKAADVVKQQWFSDAVNYKQPIDLFILLGHNAPRPTALNSTFGTYYNAIRSLRPDIPIQVFGGHTHVRDFVVYPDGKGTGLESGRFCETLGWLSMSGIKSTSYQGAALPQGLAHPNRKAIPPNSTWNGNSTNNILYSRRYLDWNKATFEFHTTGGSNSYNQKQFDTKEGQAISKEITTDRKKLNLTSLIGCAPQAWCIYCAPHTSQGSIFSLLPKALSKIVVNPARKAAPRLITITTGSVRFDLPKGPFTYDDTFIVSPYNYTFQYIANVPYSQARQVLGTLNKGAMQKRAELSIREMGMEFLTSNLPNFDSCVNPFLEQHDGVKRRTEFVNKVHRRQQETPGYTTNDDFGSDGDDTAHSKIPFIIPPNVLQANASFPGDGNAPANVDMIFLDIMQPNVISALNSAGGKYSKADVQQYLPINYTASSYLTAYIKQAPDWQANVLNCPVGEGIGIGND